jgi:hypothetical protein
MMRYWFRGRGCKNEALEARLSDYLDSQNGNPSKINLGKVACFSSRKVAVLLSAFTSNPPQIHHQKTTFCTPFFAQTPSKSAGYPPPEKTTAKASSSSVCRWNFFSARRGRRSGRPYRSGLRGFVCACRPRTCARRGGASSGSSCCEGRSSVEPFAANQSETGQFLGNVCYPPYTGCN